MEPSCEVKRRIDCWNEKTLRRKLSSPSSWASIIDARNEREEGGEQVSLWLLPVRCCFLACLTSRTLNMEAICSFEVSTDFHKLHCATFNNIHDLILPSVRS
jgi:hypothetical protein